MRCCVCFTLWQTSHRCPGEDLTLRLLGVSLRVLAVVDYEPVSSPAADRARIPTLPGDGLRVRVGGEVAAIGPTPEQKRITRERWGWILKS